MTSLSLSLIDWSSSPSYRISAFIANCSDSSDCYLFASLLSYFYRKTALHLAKCDMLRDGTGTSRESPSKSQFGWIGSKDKAEFSIETGGSLQPLVNDAVCCLPLCSCFAQKVGSRFHWHDPER